MSYEVAPWFCVQSVPNQERRAFLSISAAGFSSHLPKVRHRRRNHGKIETVIRPLFPSYLFVSFDPDCDAWGCIYRLPGVRRLFTNIAGRPAALPLGEIERLREMGIIDDAAPVSPEFLPGQTLRVVDGPFVDWLVVCQRSDEQRVEVLMTMLGGERVVALPRTSVELADG